MGWYAPLSTETAVMTLYQLLATYTLPPMPHAEDPTHSMGMAPSQYRTWSLPANVVLGHFMLAENYLDTESCFPPLGMEVQKSQAIHHYTAAAYGGSVLAAYRLGMLAATSRDTYKESESWFRYAADRGFTLAQVALGDLFWHQQCYASAAPWYRLAADHGYSEACVRLAFMHKMGAGVPANMVSAMHWLRRGTSKKRSDWSGVPLFMRITAGTMGSELSAS